MTVRVESKAQYMARRKARVRRLYVDDRLTPRQIAALLVREGIIETSDESLASATRIVQQDVASIREEVVSLRVSDADPGVAFDDLDALEGELVGLRTERDRQLVIAAGEPTEMCAVSRLVVAQCVAPECLAREQHRVFVGPAIGVTMMDTPQGMMTSWKALWPASVRQKASKDAAILTRQISELEIRLTERRAEQTAVPVGGEKTESDGRFSFNFPNVQDGTPDDLAAMIAANLGQERSN